MLHAVLNYCIPYPLFCMYQWAALSSKSNLSQYEKNCLQYAKMCSIATALAVTALLASAKLANKLGSSYAPLGTVAGAMLPQIYYTVFVLKTLGKSTQGAYSAYKANHWASTARHLGWIAAISIASSVGVVGPLYDFMGKPLSPLFKKREYKNNLIAP